MKFLKTKKLLTVFSVMALFSCGNKDPYTFLNPKLPYEQPFKFDKAGDKSTVDFWILPKLQKVDGSEGYGVSFSFGHTLDNDPSERIKALEIPMHAELYLVKGQTMLPVAFKAKNQFTDTVPLDNYAGKGSVYPDDHGLDLSGGTEYTILWFKPSEYGQYRVVLESKKDNPSIGSVDFKLRISNIHFGK